MTALDPCGDFIRDVLAFLEQPEHEIVSVSSENEDVSNSPCIYYGLSLGWEQERDALITRARAVVPSENQWYMRITEPGKAPVPADWPIEVRNEHDST